MIFKLPTALALSLVILIAPAASAAAQQKRRTPVKPQTPSKTQTPTKEPLPTKAAPADKTQPSSKTQPPVKTQPSPAVTSAPTPTPPPPTFDTLLAADSYKIYGEIRSVGQLIKSNSVNEILEPILKLAAPPKEFRTIVNWLNTHADEVMSSRLLVAFSPMTVVVSHDLVRDTQTQTNVSSVPRALPSSLVAIEFASPEEAARFHQQLDPFLKKYLPPTTAPTPDSTKVPEKSAPEEPIPSYHIQQAGSLILITPTPLKIQNLRPAGSKLLAEDVNFRVARNRLNTESIFIYFDVDGISREEEEQRKKYEAMRKEVVVNGAVVEEGLEAEAAETRKIIEEMEKAEKAEREKGEQAEPDEPPVPEQPQYDVEFKVDGAPAQNTGDPPAPPPFFMGLSMLMSNLSGFDAKWPSAVGLGLSLEGESFDVRAMLVTAPGEKSDPIPFLPVLAPGPAITPEAANILPADTYMLVTLSLDLPHIYTAMAKPLATMSNVDTRGKVPESVELESPIAQMERKLNLKLKDDLLPLIGPEIAISIPKSGADWFQPPPPPQPTTSPSPSPAPDASRNEAVVGVVKNEVKNGTKNEESLAIAISLKDKEGMRALMPKIVESLAFKGASALAQTERREDTELVSYANLVAYAFIGNFLVVSPDAATTRHIVDSYLKHQTLAGDPNFKNYTRWQPRQLHGQLYISPFLMESYRTYVQQPTAAIDEPTRAFLTRFSIVPQPVTYSLSNEGFGPLHELHIPKNLVLLMIAASAGALNTPPPDVNTTEPKPVPVPEVRQPNSPARPF